MTGPGGAFVQGAPRRTRSKTCENEIIYFLSSNPCVAAGPRGSRGPRKDKAAAPGEGGEAAAPAEAAKA